MQLRNAICHKFERLVNDEVAAGCQFDHLKVDALRNQIITPEGKRAMGYRANHHLTMYDFVRASVDVLSKLRFIYLLSLIEAFGKDYIAQRESIQLEDVTRTLSAQQSSWQQTQTGVLASTSLLNLAYLGFVMRERYSLDFGSVRSACFWEAGVLRNCLVHYSGFIPNEAFRSGLAACIAETRIPDSVGAQICVTDKLMWVLIDETRAFLAACDY